MMEATIPRPKRVVSGRAVALCAVITGLLLWLATDVRWLSGLAWVALAPLALLARVPAPPRKLYLGAYLGGLTFFVPGVWWLGSAAPEWWQAALMRGLLAGYLALYFPLFLLLVRLLARLRIPLLLAIPAAWTACEFLRMHLLTGFGWLMLAHALWRWEWTIQLADLGGVYAVSFLAALPSALVVELLTQPLMVMQQGKAKFDPAGGLTWRLWTTAFALGLALLYGAQRVREGEAAFKDGLSVALLHTDLPQSVKNEDPVAADAHIRKGIEARPGIDLVVWPETALQAYRYGHVDPAVPDAEVVRLFLAGVPTQPGDWRADDVRRILAEGRADAQSLVERYQAPLLVCVGRHDLRNGRLHKHNASVLLRPGRGEVGWYGKVHLVPFGEYLPLKDAFPFLKVLMPFEPEHLEYFGWHTGAAPAPIRHGNVNVGPLVCFEDTIPDLARAHAAAETAEAPLDFLANHTNDGWFGGTREPYRHLAAAAFRCVECRAPMVRSTNLGVTCVIDGNGKVVERVEDISKATTLFARIPFDPRRAPYVGWGDAFAWGCAALCLAGVAAALLDVLRRTRQRLSER